MLGPIVGSSGALARLSARSAMRYASTLAIVEHANSKIASGTLAALTAAKQLGNPVTALVTGSDAESVAQQVAKTKGVDKVVFIANDTYDHALPEPFAELLSKIIPKGDFSHVIAASSAVGRNVVPRVGALLDLQPVTDIVKILGEDTFIRPIFAGNALETVKTGDKIKLLTVRPTAFAPVELEGGTAAVEAGEDVSASKISEFVSEQLTKSERPELATATRVVSGGRGLKNRENFEKIIFPFADALNAAVGASRAAVDEGYADNSLQVGQTGKVVAPELYIAVGISGAIQHLAGMKDSKVIACVNKSDEAPIFHVADVGLVADLFEAVPELTSKLKA